MIKKITLFLSALFLSQIAVAEIDKEVLKKASAALSNLTTIEADFSQTASSGGVSRGKFYLKKPGKMRLEYESPILMIVDGKNLIYVDKNLDQVSYIPLSSTPANIMLGSKIDLTSNKVKVNETIKKDGQVIIDATSGEDPTIGSISLVFDAKSYEFLGWQLIDAVGVETKVSLKNVKKGGRLKDVIFRYDKQTNYSSEENIGDF